MGRRPRGHVPDPLGGRAGLDARHALDGRWAASSARTTSSRSPGRLPRSAASAAPAATSWTSGSTTASRGWSRAGTSRASTSCSRRRPRGLRSRLAPGTTRETIRWMPSTRPARGRLHRHLQHHGPAGDLAAARRGGRPPGRRPARRRAGPRGPPDPGRGAARARRALGGPCRADVRRVALSPMTPFRGVLTAMVTPFADDRSLDVAGARKLASYLVENGSHGVVVAGTTGEGPTLSDDETIELLEAVLDEIGSDATVICGTGSNDTRHAADLTHRAAQAGAHGVLVVAPYYNKPIEDGLRAHFAEVSEAAGETPIALYNIPSRSVINMSPEFIGSLAAEFREHRRGQAGEQRRDRADRAASSAGGKRRRLRSLPSRGRRRAASSSPRTSWDRRMREIFDAASEDDHDRALEIERELADIYAAIAERAARELGQGDPRHARPDRRDAAPADGPVPGPAREALAEIAESVLMSKIKILPLGGLGEIGKNMTAIECDGRIVIVDAGVMFPTAEMLGHRPRPAGLHLAPGAQGRHRRSDPHPRARGPRGRGPLRAPRAGHPRGDLRRPADARARALEARGAKDPRRRRWSCSSPGERAQAGPFEIETIHMSHSIPDARAVALHTKLGAILDHGRLPLRPDPGRRAPCRHRAPRRARLGGRPLPVRRLDQRRPAWRRCRPSGRSAPRFTRCSRAARGASSSPASPPTSTASSR